MEEEEQISIWTKMVVPCISPCIDMHCDLSYKSIVWILVLWCTLLLMHDAFQVISFKMLGYVIQTLSLYKCHRHEMILCNFLEDSYRSSYTFWNQAPIVDNKLSKIWVCAAFVTHLFTPISSSGDPQFQVDLQLRSPNSQFSPKKLKSSPNRLKSSPNISMTHKGNPKLPKNQPKWAQN